MGGMVKLKKALGFAWLGVINHIDSDLIIITCKTSTTMIRKIKLGVLILGCFLLFSCVLNEPVAIQNTPCNTIRQIKFEPDRITLNDTTFITSISWKIWKKLPEKLLVNTTTKASISSAFLFAVDSLYKIEATVQNQCGMTIRLDTTFDCTLDNLFSITLDKNIVDVPGGRFPMGQGISLGVSEKIAFQKSSSDTVSVNPFSISKYELTRNEWVTIMRTNVGRKDTTNFSWCSQCPITHVRLIDVINFIEFINQKSQQYEYRLPTEAEWEFAARGGNPLSPTFNYKFAGTSNQLSDVAWTLYNSGARAFPVGTRQANSLGLYDMTGNASEWCTRKNAPLNTLGDADFLQRGGSFVDTFINLDSQKGMLYLYYTVVDLGYKNGFIHDKTDNSYNYGTQKTETAGIRLIRSKK